MSVRVDQQTLAGSPSTSCDSSWTIGFPTRRLDFDLCPSGSSMARTTGQRELSESELERFVTAMSTMPLLTGGACNNGTESFGMTVYTPMAQYRLGDATRCGTDLIRVDPSQPRALLKSWTR